MSNMVFINRGIPKGKVTYEVDVFSVRNRGLVLGKIYWKTAWRRYAFEPMISTVFDAACLAEITFHLNDLMKDWKERQISAIKKKS